MISNITLEVMAGIIVTFAILVCKKKWFQLDVVDLFILFVGIDLGAYTFVKGLLENYARFDSVTIILVFSQIIIILAIILILWSLMPERLRQALEIKSLSQQWKRFNPYVIFLLLAILLTIQVVGYEKYNFISHVDHGVLYQAGKPLPYWLSSGLALSNDIIFCTFIALITKIIFSYGWVRKFWIIPLFILFVFAFIHGRRSVLNLVIIGSILIFVVKPQKLIKGRYFIVLLLLCSAFFLISNMFQSYRSVLQSPSLLKWANLKNPIAAALDADITLKNLRVRPNAWEFNYSIFWGQRHDHVPPEYGGILWTALKNSIPHIFWPRKEIVSLNDLVAKSYGLPVIDYGKNNFGFAQADFGYISAILLPILLMILFILIGVIVIISQKTPTLLLLLTCIIINHLINIEETFGDIFVLFRNIILIICIYSLGLAVVKVVNMIRGVPQRIKLSDN